MYGLVPTTEMALENIELAETFLRLEKAGDPGMAAMAAKAGPDKWSEFIAANEGVLQAAQTWPPVPGQPVPSELWESIRVQDLKLGRTGCMKMILIHPAISPMIDRESLVSWT